MNVCEPRTSEDKLCGTCIWYDRPWTSKSFGFCRWVAENPLGLALPEWVEKIPCAMNPKAGKDCRTYQEKTDGAEKSEDRKASQRSGEEDV